MSLEQIYLRLPVFLQNLGCTLEGLRIQNKRYGAGFRRRLAESESRATMSQEQIAEFRDQRIRDFVNHCAATVPYYRNLFHQLRISPADIRGLDDLRRLPVLTKHEVQERGAEFVSEMVAQYNCDSVHTSGTTGGGLQFLVTNEAVEEQWATWWRYRRWHGIELDTWCAYFGGRSLVPIQQTAPPFWRTNYPGKQLFFSAYHMTPGNLRHYAQKLRAAKIPWLHGYPSLLSLLAGYILDTGFDLGYQPRWITTGAENLLSQQVSVVREAFGVRPVQHYGMAEAVANISECDRGALHVDEDFAAVEFVEDQQGRSRVIGTNFSNLATPLLRYDAQDIVWKADRACDCGRPGRIVDSIDGRLEDYVVLKSGARLGRLDHIFKNMVHVREAQIVQRESGVLDILVVRGEKYAQSDEQLLRREFAQRVGSDTEFKIEYVDELRRTNAGKLRFVASEMRDNEVVAGNR
jgi:phenylacetate-coenzyme A ligase PaaK-like adenylate-forming protein